MSDVSSDCSQTGNMHDRIIFLSFICTLVKSFLRPTDFGRMREEVIIVFRLMFLSSYCLYLIPDKACLCMHLRFDTPFSHTFIANLFQLSLLICLFSKILVINSQTYFVQNLMDRGAIFKIFDLCSCIKNIKKTLKRTKSHLFVHQILKRINHTIT